MDFQSAMETFAEAWVAANTKPDAVNDAVQNQALSLTRNCKSPSRGSSPMGRDGDRAERPPSRPRSAARPPPVADSTDALLTPKKEIFDLSKTSAKSLPVHCIVEGVSVLEGLCGNGSMGTAGIRRPSVEADSYVIIPASTAFRELVAAALLRLGYPNDCAAAAKGSVVIKNWKPLTFDRISDGPMATVGEILGELTTVATLRIQVLRPRPSPLQEIKDKLLRLLLVQSHTVLLSTGCPLDEVTLSQICRGSTVPPGPHSYHELNDDIKRKFEQWWNAQVTPRPQYSPRQQPSPITKLERPPSLGPLPDHVHPALQTVQSQYPTQKTRMRTSFDPELELPKLQRWFADNQHPSRQQIQHYVRELNNLESRRGRKPLDVNNVVYWFKNARAAQKRAELRNIGPGGLSCHLSLNGYNSSSHSPPNGAMMMSHDAYMSSDRLSEHHSMKSPLSISPGRGHPMSVISEDNLSNGGSDVEDDDMMDVQREDERPETPEAPLSLITTKKDVEPETGRRDSPKPPDIPKIDNIKQEPMSDDTCKPQDLSPTHFPINNNNNHVDNNNSKGTLENNISEDEEEEEVEHENMDEDIKPGRRLSEESLQTMHPSRVADMNRLRMRSIRSPSPSEMMGGGQIVPRCPPGANMDRLTAAGFPLVPNSMFSHSIMYMSHYIPGLTHGGHNLPSSPPGSSGLNLSALAASAADERRKRNRTFIDPVTEVPRLEQWFSLNTHPSHNLILKYTEELNRMPYRQKFPRLESKNVQFWFKNRRAKCKRLKMSLYESGPPGSMPQYHVNDRD